MTGGGHADHEEVEAPSYGTTHTTYAGADSSEAIKKKSQFRKRRMNAVAMWLCIMIPWLVYCAVYSARTFGIRTKNPPASKGIVFLCFLVVLMCFALASSQISKKRSGNPTYEPMWYIFLAITTFLAWILGLGSAEVTFNTYMMNFYGYQQLNDYWYVDPARNRGAQMMDAGTVYFVNTTYLQVQYSMGFRNDGVYCVAPITSVGAPLASYDFWAVGMNCCSGSSNDFACANNINASHQGLRVLSDGSRGYYRLAVQQAEATYGIRSEHPLFFHWVGDTNAVKASAYASGWSTYMVGMFVYFFFQCLLVIIACCIFSKVVAY